MEIPRIPMPEAMTSAHFLGFLVLWHMEISKIPVPETVAAIYFVGFLVFGYCLSLCFLACELHIGNWKGRLVPYLQEFKSRSKGPTTLRAIGLTSTPN